MKKIGWCLFLFLLLACSHQQERMLQDSLNRAGINRHSMEQVLGYYTQSDSNQEKLEAAEFLIAHMLNHASLNDDLIDAYADSLSQYGTSLPKEQIYHLWEQVKTSFHDSPRARKTNDLETLSADYLIDNIDASYKAWKESPWHAQISFEIYCQYILPYRIHQERLSKIGWRDSLSARYKSLIQNETDIKKAYTIIVQHITHQFRNTQPAYPIQPDAMSIDKIRPGNCSLRCMLTIYVLRALGIPACYDFVPFWSNYSTVGHSWVALVTHSDSTFSLHKGDSLPKYRNIVDGSVFQTDFRPEDDYPFLLDSIKKVSRIYRYSYERKTGENNHVDTVSRFYGIDKNMIIEHAPIRSGNCRLSVFMTGKDWYVIDVAAVTQHKVSFPAVGTNQLYLLTFTGKEKEMSVPVIFHDDGRLQYLNPDTNWTAPVTVYRKYPLYVHLVETWCKMKGCVVEASMWPDFRQTEVLLTVDRTPSRFVLHSVAPRKVYRYIRYRSTNRWATALAEFEVYGEERLEGRPIGSHPDAEILSRGTDGQYQTFVTSQGPDYWFGLDLGPKAPIIEKIRFLPKNDANFVEPGHEYELCYYKNGWISTGIRKATCDSLIYQLPNNSLMILRDQTDGKEERPFTYRNGKQVWW